MDETRFGLSQRPFPATPDTTFYYPATGSERALARLLDAIADEEGLIILTGEPGTGKTLLCHCLIERLGSGVTSIFLTNSHFRDRLSLLQVILFDLSLPYEGRAEQELRLALTDFLLKNYQAERRAILIVDEAQHLTEDVLEELRLLGNLEGQRKKAIQVILVGQPGLEETLRRPQLVAFSQRVAVRTRLEALGVHEAADYLVHHLRTAGGRPDSIITDEALEMLARGTRGLPRLLNQTGQHALALAQTTEAAEVDVEVALEALATFGLEAEECEVQPVSDEGPAQDNLFGTAEEIRAQVDEESRVEGESESSPPPEGPGPPPNSPTKRLFALPRRSA